MEATTALMLAAAAAAMLTVSIVDLGINIARDLGLRQTLLLSASGALTVVLAKNLCIALLNHTNMQAGKAAAAVAAESEAEAEAEDTPGKLRLVRVGLVTAVSLTAHNMPEGMAVAFSTMDSESLGLKLAIAIALHNIPEGLAIGAPFSYLHLLTGILWRAIGARHWCSIYLLCSYKSTNTDAKNAAIACPLVLSKKYSLLGAVALALASGLSEPVLLFRRLYKCGAAAVSTSV